MQNWKKSLVRPETPLVEAIKIIDSGGGQIAIVTDDAGHLLGTVTDADVRKAILRGSDFQIPCSSVMSTNPVKLHVDSPEGECLEMMRKRHVRQLLLVDDAGMLVDMVLLMDIMSPPRLNNPVVIMAGGLGSRLQHLTQHLPKPMLKVGSKPLLETVLEQFISHGFWRFYFSVNYKSDIIFEYFGDGAKWGVEIQYLHEDKRLGTAGALHMLPENIEEDLLVMNGDILTKVNLHQMLVHHRQHHATATMAVKDYIHTIPYGVVAVDEECMIESIREKPSHSFFVNAGIYVLSPGALKYIPKSEFFDMPTLFKTLIDRNIKTSAFPLREYWIDIGVPRDYEQANFEYNDHFDCD